MVDRESGVELCTLLLSDLHSLVQVRRAIKAQCRGLRDFVFLYPDGVRIHPRQESTIHMAIFGGRITLLQAPRASTGTDVCRNMSAYQSCVSAIPLYVGAGNFSTPLLERCEQGIDKTLCSSS